VHNQSTHVYLTHPWTSQLLRCIVLIPHTYCKRSSTTGNRLLDTSTAKQVATPPHTRQYLSYQLGL